MRSGTLRRGKLSKWKGRPGSAAPSRQSSRGASLDPERATLKKFNEIWNRHGKHSKSGTARICLFHFVRGNCNRDNCDFSHDPSLKLQGKEKSDAILEMDIRFPKPDGKAKGKAKAKAKSGARAATPIANTYDADGAIHCRKNLAGTCEKGDQCPWSHKA